MKKLLLVAMMLCLVQSELFAFDWDLAIISKKDDGSWQYTAEQILDAAVEYKIGFEFDVWNFAVQHGRSDIIKVLLKEKPGYNATYGDILNKNTGGVKVELGRDERFLFDVDLRHPMRTELQTALYYGQKEAAIEMIKLGANPFKNGRIDDKLHNNEDPGMSTRDFAVQGEGNLGDFFDNVILKMPEVTNNLAKLKREAEIYNEKFRKTRQYAYADPAEMKMQRNKSIKEMLLAVCDALRSKFSPQAGTIKRASQAA